MDNIIMTLILAFAAFSASSQVGSDEASATSPARPETMSRAHRTFKTIKYQFQALNDCQDADVIMYCTMH